MNIKKVFIAGIAGGVAYFFLGWLVYGILLKDFMASHTNNSTMRPDDEMIWWAMIASSLFWGIFLAYIFNKWANINSLAAGASAGTVITLLISLSYCLSFYSMTTMYNDTTGLIVDIITATVMGLITGAIVGFVLGQIKD